MPLAVTDSTFHAEVKESNLPVLVDFWGLQCPPCTMIAPIIEELSREYEGKVKIVKADMNTNAEVASALDIMAVPTLILFRYGKEVTRHMGFAPKEQIIKNLLDKA